MATSTSPADVDAYLAALAAPTRHVLELVRETLRKAVPGAEEVISYKMPTLTLHGRALLHFAGWKEHWALYAVSHEVASALGEELAPYDAGKGTLHFALDAQVPVQLLRRIAKLRAEEVDKAARAKQKPAKKA